MGGSDPFDRSPLDHRDHGRSVRHALQGRGARVRVAVGLRFRNQRMVVVDLVVQMGRPRLLRSQPVEVVVVVGVRGDGVEAGRVVHGEEAVPMGSPPSLEPMDWVVRARCRKSPQGG